MSRRIKGFICILLVLALCSGFAACAKNKAPQGSDLAAKDLGVIHEPEFGGVYITMTIDDFNALGFKYGDSVKVEFSNGYVMEDLPYYNGYYVDAGEPLLVAYPGYDYIKAALNYGDDLWDIAALSESDTATVTLVSHGTYLDVQEARDIHYFDEREKYDTDEIFANFRNVQAGDLKENVLYRSASPCDNQHNRAHYVDRLIEAAGVNCILNLSDNEGKIEGYIAAEDFDSPYFMSLYQAGKVLLLSMNMNYNSDEFKQKLAAGLTQMAGMEGPYLVHCTEGKDRTGFVCILLEAFAGASYEEIVADYMLTYDNYYKITEASDPAKYSTIKEKNVDAMLKSILGDPAADLAAADLAAGAESYLLNAGMAEADVAALHGRLEK
jgi:protein tyrosine/serine phosphatase